MGPVGAEPEGCYASAGRADGVDAVPEASAGSEHRGSHGEPLAPQVRTLPNSVVSVNVAVQADLTAHIIESGEAAMHSIVDA